MKWLITFKKREVFNKWTDQTLGFYDVGYSDMVLLFDNKEDWILTQNAMIMNHLKDGEDFIAEDTIVEKGLFYD